MPNPSADNEHAATWDPEVLERIRHLHLRARHAVKSLVHGGHRSIRVGAGVEFADYRDYHPGDPLRDLDWKVAARTDRLVVRRQVTETELSCTLVIDASGDLGTGVSKRPDLERDKLGYAICLAATLATFIHHQGDPVGLAIIAGDSVRWPWIPPRRGRAHLAQVFGALASLKAGGRANLEEAFRQVGARLGPSPLVVVISDLMEEPDSWGSALAWLSQGSADLRVVHLHDPREWSLDYSSSARFWSPEGGPSLPVDPHEARGPFREVVDEYIAEVRQHLSAHQSLYISGPCTTPLEVVLGELIQDRS
ncbi:MAG: DUF58 domain-containing protein [Myxococcota bacterium]|nr:DUF58 domain-containing protein [Myxococcota bacterium]